MVKTFKIEDENVTLAADLPIETVGDSGTLVTDTECIRPRNGASTLDGLTL
jgi:hypothetical protein